MPQPPSGTRPSRPFIELQSVDSTNNYARSLLSEGQLPERQGKNPGIKTPGPVMNGTAVFAHEQLAGKGQRGKTWSTEKGANIILSVLISPHPLLLTDQFQLSACIAVSISEFFVKYAGEGISIKWPNDIYWHDRKAGGILIESVVGREEQGAGGSQQSAVDSQQSAVGSQESALETPGHWNWNWAIIGIGININQTSFPAELKNPVSLKQITGKEFNTVEMAKELCLLLEINIDRLKEQGFDNFYNKYQELLYQKNKKVKLKKESRVFEAVIKGVTPAGKLIVQHGIEEELDFGGVEWII